MISTNWSNLLKSVSTSAYEAITPTPFHKKSSRPSTGPTRHREGNLKRFCFLYSVFHVPILLENYYIHLAYIVNNLYAPCRQSNFLQSKYLCAICWPMPSDKPKIIFVAEEDLLQQVDDFQSENHIANRSEAVRRLLRLSLRMREILSDENSAEIAFSSLEGKSVNDISTDLGIDQKTVKRVRRTIISTLSEWSRSEPDQIFRNMTQTEHDVLSAIIEGKKGKEIADDLGLTERRYDRTKQSILSKLRGYSAS